MKLFCLTVFLAITGLSTQAQNQRPIIASSDDIYAEKNTPITLGYEKLKALSGAYDADGDTVYLQISGVVNGRLTKNSQTIVPGVTRVGPGESLVWMPPTNVFNEWIAAFKVRGYDLKSYSDTTEVIGASITGNTPPELTLMHLFSKANFQHARMNTPYPITFQHLSEASDLRDVDDDTPSFLIVSVNSGRLEMDGNPIVAGQTVFGTTNTLVWFPATNVIGRAISAFSVRGFDGKEQSLASVAVKFDVTDPTPRFAKGMDQTVLRTSLDHFVWNWATSIGPDDSVLHFEVSNDNPSMFLNQPAIDDDGTLSYSVDGLAYGVANITVVLVDDSGRRSVPQTFNINVLREPTFSLRTNIVTASYLALPNVVAGFARDISRGTANESKAVSFIVTAMNPAFFSSKPTIATNGTLSFKLAANVGGTTLVTVTATDGKLRSSSETFSVFVPANPFISGKGKYTGLFFESDEVRHQSSGLMSLSVTQNGTCSGKISVDGRAHSFSGSFNLTGQITATVLRLGKSSLKVAMQLDDNELSGTIGDQEWTASLNADRAVFSAMNASPQAGKYTMILPKSASTPLGNGAAAITVTTAGMTALSGTLADGTKITQSTTISKSSQAPFYVSLYGGRGSALGWITLSNRVNGTVSWIKTTNTIGGFTASFTNELTAVGSVFRTNAPALIVTNGVVLLTNATPCQSFQINVSAKGNNFSGNGLTLSVNPKTGLVTGNFFHPTSKTTAPVFGAVLQDQNNVSGFYLGAKDSGELAGFKK